MIGKPYTYVLVRRDIAPQHQMVQACHAALEAGFAFEAPATVSSLIVLTVPDQETLIQAQEQLMEQDIRSEMFFEPCWEMGYSALATETIFEKKKRAALSKYPLHKISSDTTVKH